MPEDAEEVIYCGGPLVIERIAPDIEAACQARGNDQPLMVEQALPDFVFSEPAEMMISWPEPCDPPTWAAMDRAALREYGDELLPLPYLGPDPTLFDLAEKISRQVRESVLVPSHLLQAGPRLGERSDPPLALSPDLLSITRDIARGG